MEGGEAEKEEREGWRVSWKADVPDAMNVLDSVADFLAEFFLVKLHLKGRQRKEDVVKHAHADFVFSLTHRSLSCDFVDYSCNICF